MHEDKAAPPVRSSKRWLVLAGVLVVLFVGGCLALALSNSLGRAFLSGMFEVSRPADVANPQTFRGPTCTVDYPGNWVLDEADEDYDPAARFDIDAPAQGSVSFFLYPADTEVQAVVDAIVEELDGGLVRQATRGAFASWGPHEGYGVELDGMITLFPGRIRVFGLETEHGSAVIMETRFDEDEAHAAPGHDLIATSFTLTPSE